MGTLKFETRRVRASDSLEPLGLEVNGQGRAA